MNSGKRISVVGCADRTLSNPDETVPDCASGETVTYDSEDSSDQEKRKFTH